MSRYLNIYLSNVIPIHFANVIIFSKNKLEQNLFYICK